MWDSAEILLQLTYSSLGYLRLLLYWITMILTYDIVMVKNTRLGSQTVQVKVWHCFSGTCIKQTDNKTLFWDMLWWLNEMIHVNDLYKYEVYSTGWLIQTLTLIVKTHFVSTFSKLCCPHTVIKSRVEKLLNPKWGHTLILLNNPPVHCYCEIEEESGGKWPPLSQGKL